MIDFLTNQNLTGATNLNLRNLGLTSNDAISIASELKSTTASKLASISLSYNPIGGEDAIALAESFPTSIREIGLVG